MTVTLTPLRMPTVTSLMKEDKNGPKNQEIILGLGYSNTEQDSSVGDALALALCCARFCWALLILFASYSLAPLLMRLRHFARSCAICSHYSVGMLKSLKEAFRVSLYRFV